MHCQSIPDAKYNQALIDTNPKISDIPNFGSDCEKKMLDGVISLFTNYCEKNLSKNITKIYAENVYFRDAFKQFSKAEEVKDYMIKGLKPLHKAEFIFNRIARTGGDYYFDWTMRLDFKKTPPGSWEESIGVSHMRFNADGKVVFHQDYWDPTDIVYRRIPVVKQIIAYVKTLL